MQKIKIGQIGVCHEHAEGIIQGLRQLPETFEIVGVVDDRKTCAAKIAGSNLASYDGLKWLTVEELLATPGLQAVAVETPNTDLVPTAMRCMENNLHIHMDKPAGEDIGLFKELLDGCEKRNLVFQMGYMFRNNPAMQFCMKAVKHHWLGEIFEVHANMSHNYGGDAYQHYLSNFKGGIMFNLGCHLIDFIIAILGRPTNVTSFLKSSSAAFAGTQNNCLAVLEYPHTIATVQACSHEVSGLNHRRLKICGTNGTIELSPLERFDGQPLDMRLTLSVDNEEYLSGTHIIHFPPRKDRYIEQLLEFASIIRGDIQNPYTYEHDQLVQEVLLAASGYNLSF
jgi:predicted dehydrogenase